jgi:DNA-binding IscR family transcriptional regulator
MSTEQEVGQSAWKIREAADDLAKEALKCMLTSAIRKSVDSVEEVLEEYSLDTLIENFTDEEVGNFLADKSYGCVVPARLKEGE